MTAYLVGLWNAELGIDVGDKHEPGAASPDGEALFALWDSMLASLRQRPGAY
ncbi:hypothetical protein [Luteimonas salinilitoris]|uniref:Uncharacterized protein n=1 Tax=Luteimonas salinilitoris TaxID=3237697 RepID=A0ABV4HNM7_9GAMM